MSTPSGVPQAPVSAGGVEGQAAVIGEVAKEMYSLRFDGSSYLSRTPTTTGDRKVFTLSFWFKKGGTSVYSVIFSVGTSYPLKYQFAPNDSMYFYLPNTASTNWSGIKWTNQTFRDLTAWYHFVISSNTNTGILSCYVNGELAALSDHSSITNWSIDSKVNLQNAPHFIGQQGTGTGYYFNGYLSNIHFIDGEALEPSAFGELISDVWRPASYSGDYGVNGFHLDFDPDNMIYDSNGKLTQVKDASGNDNHWTAN